MRYLAPDERAVVDALKDVYMTIQQCPDGPAAGRATALALIAEEDERRGTSHLASIEALLNRIDTELWGDAL